MMVFSTQQLAQLRSLARQTANFSGLTLTYTRTRLLVHSGPTVDDYAAGFGLLLVGGILGLVCFGFAAADREWLLASGLLLALAGGAWLGLRMHRRRLARPSAPPNFVYDLPEHSFYFLRSPATDGAAYDCYPASLLTAAQPVVLSVGRYGKSMAVELAFGTKRVRVMHQIDESLATEIAQILWNFKLRR